MIAKRSNFVLSLIVTTCESSANLSFVASKLKQTSSLKDRKFLIFISCIIIICFVGEDTNKIPHLVLLFLKSAKYLHFLCLGSHYWLFITSKTWKNWKFCNVRQCPDYSVGLLFCLLSDILFVHIIVVNIYSEML